MSWPTFIADWVRNMPRTPTAIIEYNCQPPSAAPMPALSVWVIPFINAAQSPNAAPAAAARTAVWAAPAAGRLASRLGLSPAGPCRPHTASLPTTARFTPMPASHTYHRMPAERAGLQEKANGDRKRATEPHRLVQQAPDHPKAECLMPLRPGVYAGACRVAGGYDENGADRPSIGVA